MISGLIKFIMRLGFYAILFFGAVWFFLGMPPNETYARARVQMNKMFGRAQTLSQGTQTQVSQMGQEYNTQIQHASDRFHGKDPYERFNNRLNDVVTSGGAEVNLRGN